MNSNEHRQNLVKSAFSTPEDEELIVRFLKKRLEQKSNSGSVADTSSRCGRSQESEHTVQDLTEMVKFEAVKSQRLSMQQILPFPKTSKHGFFSRMKNNFRRYKRCPDFCEIFATDNESKVSAFKFPRRSKQSVPVTRAARLFCSPDMMAGSSVWCRDGETRDSHKTALSKDYVCLI